MALAVVTVAAGGLAITETANGMAVTEAANGIGLAVTKVVGKPYGRPVTFVSATGGPVAPVFATFNVAPSTAFITMSNGNLTVTKNTTAQTGTARSSSVQSAGKYYFELTNTIKSAGTGHVLGLALATTTDANVAGGITTFAAFPGNLTTIYSNNIDQSKNLGLAASGDVYGYAIDLTGRLGWIRRAGGNWNGDPTANPATGIGGVIIGAGAFAPVVYLSTGSAIDSVTANFGASAFAGVVPSGFTAGLPA